ncbi:MAG: hypothetical protein IJQ68_01650 [Methanobrevibacter sp.]|uniref:hypothetical protein n=1 Tax=Methanobrevibacter sp. TaxID=66852 RepID=UPI0025D1F9F5|nr:hypothetical protein [Methanobrevibacter sp.]MBR0270685.1 hypothetical protein [Methanobrevibacter sp.]
MTTEILAMNRNSIAIAVDSAVTINRQKTANGFTKLFPIDNFPMAIMMYGSANFENIPMENLIADFINTTNFDETDNIEKVKSLFLDFLAQNTPKHNFKKDIESRLDIFKKEITEYFARLNDEEIDSEIQYYLGLEIPYFVLKLEEYSQYDHYFKILKKELGLGKWKAFKNYFFHQLCLYSTGIVIMGFGKYDNFPSYMNFDMVVNNDGNIEISNEQSELCYEYNIIVPFAQTDVILGYLDGIRPEFHDFISISHLIFLNDFLDNFLEFIDFENNLSEGSINNVLKKVNDFKSQLITQNHNFLNYLEFGKEYFFNNFLESMSLLSKEEMAKMVKLLVEITSLRFKVSQELNIVGGEINVGVISKLDGFVWIEKEEYFDEKF